MKLWGEHGSVGGFLSSLYLGAGKTGAQGGKRRAAIQVQKKSRKLSQRGGCQAARGGRLANYTFLGGPFRKVAPGSRMRVLNDVGRDGPTRRQHVEGA